VPPHAGTGLVGRIEKAVQQGVGLRSAGFRSGGSLSEKWT
jgi:hypothetical protein